MNLNTKLKFKHEQEKVTYYLLLTNSCEKDIKRIWKIKLNLNHYEPVQTVCRKI